MLALVGKRECLLTELNSVTLSSTPLYLLSCTAVLRTEWLLLWQVDAAQFLLRSHCPWVSMHLPRSQSRVQAASALHWGQTSLQM